eukprot:CAMPEP_0197719932 /NCGR_PEP_ID=MMETSP1434-20131217/3477_1 /TAXON_ID=265543 /ORGANISM="Minutocellus polymorphus, Strain CCMP3303" /LENGTH=237 /DNA_ID=CAMNT_0043304721 /DNA_START=37 /DNA_END=750 /DNA_ORIENTATION=-
MPASSGSASSLIFASSATVAAVFAAYRIYRWSSGRNREAGDHRVTVSLPPWATEENYFSRTYDTDDEMMALAVELSARNVAEKTGGPFGCAIYKRNLETGCAELVSVGMNRVVPLHNSTLHGETVAIQMAQRKLKNFALSPEEDEGGERRYQYELFTSCEPCAMCLGATLWSGVTRLVCGATKADASAIGFDEGPVFEESYKHLEEAGIEVTRRILQKEAAAVLENYGKIGVIYNAR